MVVMVVAVVVLIARSVQLARRYDVMDVLLVPPKRARVAIGLITAGDGAVVGLPLTMRLHVPRQVVVPLEGL